MHGQTIINTGFSLNCIAIELQFSIIPFLFQVFFPNHSLE